MSVARGSVSGGLVIKETWLKVAAGSGPLGLGTRILMHLEKCRLPQFGKRRELFAATLEEIAPEIGPAIDVNEAGFRHDAISPSEIQSQAIT